MATYRTIATGGGTSGTSDRTTSITPQSGDLLVVFCAASANTNSSPTCSDDNGSGTYSLIGTATWATSAKTLSCFVRNSLMSNTTSTTVTVATGSNDAAAIGIVAVSGMSKTGSNAVRQSCKQDNGPNNNPNVTFSSSCLTTNMTIGCLGNSSNPANMAAPTNWTERADTGQGTPSTGLHVVTRDSGFTGTNVVWADSGALFACFMIELDASSAEDISDPFGMAGFFGI